MNNYLKVLKKYAVFSGRASRYEYWMFFLFNIIAVVVLTAIGAAIQDKGELLALYQIAMLIPNIAVSSRRMHDSNHRGWWLLVPIIFMILTLVGSDKNANRFGPNPKSLIPKP